MNLSISFQEISDLLSKTWSKSIRFEFVCADTVKVIIKDVNEFVENKGRFAKFATSIATKLTSKTQSVNVRIVEISNNDVVLELGADNGTIDWMYKKFASYFVDQKTIMSDPSDPKKLIVRLSEIESLRKTLDIIGFYGGIGNYSCKTNKLELNKHHESFSTSSTVVQTERTSRTSKTTSETRCISFAAMRR